MPMTASEVDELCKAVCHRIWKTNLGHIFDKVVSADRRGRVDDNFYSQLLDFFYCFLPMVVNAPRSDPVVVTAGDLHSHIRIVDMFGLGRNIGLETGTNNPHRWFSRPKNPSLLEYFLSQGLGGLIPKISWPFEKQGRKRKRKREESDAEHRPKTVEEEGRNVRLTIAQGAKDQGSDMPS